MAELAVLTESLGGSELSLALRAGAHPAWFDRVSPSVEAWTDRARTIRAGFGGAAWLDALGGAFGTGRGGRARARLERAAAAGIVVTTGQQPGLLGGYLLTLAKALSARALADAIEESTGIPTA